METVVSQHVRHIGRHLGFFKILILRKIAVNFTEISINMCLQPQILKQLRIESKK